MRAQLIELVAATLGRAPSPEELTNWLADLEGGTELPTIAEEIMYELGGVGRIAGVNNTAILVNAYQNLFGRLPDNTGLNYWLNEMNAGRVDLGNLIPSLLAGARAETGNSNDALVINGRLLAATQYLDGLDGDDSYSPSAAAAAVSAITRGSVADSAEEPSDLYDPNDQGDGDNGDGNTFTLQEALAAAELPDIYTISDIATVHAAATVAEVTDANTVTVIAGAENVADYEYSLSDTVAHLVDAGAANTVDGAVNVTATDSATVAQGDTLVAAANTGTTTYNLEDTAAALAAAAAGTLNGAANVTASDAATLAEAETIADATNSGSTTYNIEATLNALVTEAKKAVAADKNDLDQATSITATDISEVVTFNNTDQDLAATTIDFADNAATFTAAAYNTLTTDVATVSGDTITITMGNVAVAGGAANDVFDYAGTESGADITNFDAAGNDSINLADVNVAGSATDMAGGVAMASNAVFFLGAQAAGDADGDVAAAAALSAAFNNDVDMTGSFVVIADDNSSAIYAVSNTGIDGDQIAAGDLTLIGTVDAALTMGDLDFA